MLTGRLDDGDALPDDDLRKNMPRFNGAAFKSNFALVQRLVAFATQRNCSAAQIALAWLLEQGEDIVPIPGTKRVSYLEEDLAAIDVTLDTSEIAELDALFAPANVAGERYPPALMASIDRD